MACLFAPTSTSLGRGGPAPGGGGAGGQPQHGVGLGDQLSGQQRRRRLPNLLGVIVNVDLHEKTSFSNRNVS